MGVGGRSRYAISLLCTYIGLPVVRKGVCGRSRYAINLASPILNVCAALNHEVEQVSDGSSNVCIPLRICQAGVLVLRALSSEMSIAVAYTTPHDLAV